MIQDARGKSGLGEAPQPGYLIGVPKHDHLVTNVEPGVGRRVEDELTCLVDLFPHRDDDQPRFLRDARIEEGSPCQLGVGLALPSPADPFAHRPQDDMAVQPPEDPS